MEEKNSKFSRKTIVLIGLGFLLVGVIGFWFGNYKMKKDEVGGDDIYPRVGFIDLKKEPLVEPIPDCDSVYTVNLLTDMILEGIEATDELKFFRGTEVGFRIEYARELNYDQKTMTRSCEVGFQILSREKTERCKKHGDGGVLPSRSNSFRDTDRHSYMDGKKKVNCVDGYELEGAKFYIELDIYKVTTFEGGVPKETFYMRSRETHPLVKVRDIDELVEWAKDMKFVTIE
jgi:hypothetical protein